MRDEREGEGATFLGWVSRLARAHSRRLAGLARAEGLGGDDSLDAVQDALRTFLLLPQARSLVEDEEEAAALLGVLVRNVARNMRRRAHRSAPHVPLGPEPSDDSPSAEELIERAERRVRLMGCVRLLGDLQRQVVEFRMLQELSGAETAERLGISPGHIAVQLHRAKRSLLECLSG